MKRISRNRFVLKIKLYSRELIYIIHLWVYYLEFRCSNWHNEPKHYFFEEFRNKDGYKQICFNQDYKLHSDGKYIF